MLFHEPLQSAYPPTVLQCTLTVTNSDTPIVLSFHLLLHLLRLLHVGIWSQHFWDVAMQRPSCARPMNFQWFLICEVDFEFVTLFLTYFFQVFWLKFLEIFRYLSTNYVETPRTTNVFCFACWPFPSCVSASQGRVPSRWQGGVLQSDPYEKCILFTVLLLTWKKMRTYCLLSSLNFHHGKVWKSLRHCRIVVHKNGCLEVEAIWSAPCPRCPRWAMPARRPHWQQRRSLQAWCTQDVIKR